MTRRRRNPEPVRLVSVEGVTFYVDEMDAAWVSEYEWRVHLTLARLFRYQYVDDPRRPGSQKREQIFLHREILGVSEPAIAVAFADGNSLNCTRANLLLKPRQAHFHTSEGRSRAQMAMRPRGSSKYYGVSWSKQKGRWQSSISVNNKRVFLGLFDFEIDAALAYNRAVVQFGLLENRPINDLKDNSTDSSSS